MFLLQTDNSKSIQKWPKQITISFAAEKAGTEIVVQMKVEIADYDAVAVAVVPVNKSSESDEPDRKISADAGRTSTTGSPDCDEKKPAMNLNDCYLCHDCGDRLLARDRCYKTFFPCRAENGLRR